MCYHTKLTADKKAIEKEFDVEFYESECMCLEKQ